MFGSHLSIAGGLGNALREAESLRLDTVQVFTKNQRQWAVKPLDEDNARDWLAELDRLGWRGRTVAHDSYLINLASPDEALWEKSIALMREEIERCARLAIPLLVSHPGAHRGSGVEAGLERIATAYRRLFAETRGVDVTICLEDTAGGGSTLGRTFEELGELARLIHDKAGADAEGRVGFCLDTCHLLAGGYDVNTYAGARRTLKEFDRVCGLSNLRVVHLNDSKGALDSRIDRHEHIGDGHVGREGFRGVLSNPQIRRIPKIMETPKGETPKGTPLDRVNLRRLRRLVPEQGGGGRSGGGRGRSKSATRRKSVRAAGR